MNTLALDDLKSGKVKLQFGNEEQIRLLRSYEKEMEAKEGLKEYEIEYDISDWGTITVEAEDEEEAKEIAWDELRDDILDNVTLRVKKPKGKIP